MIVIFTVYAYVKTFNYSPKTYIIFINYVSKWGGEKTNSIFLRYICERVTHRKGNKLRKIFHSLVYSQIAAKAKAMQRLKSEARNFILVAHVDGRDPNTFIAFSSSLRGS